MSRIVAPLLALVWCVPAASQILIFADGFEIGDTCEWTSTVTVETCDGKDNDCDNAIDEQPICDDLLACTTDSCLGQAGCDHFIDIGWCLIDGNLCVEGGLYNPLDPCEVCLPAVVQDDWVSLTAIDGDGDGVPDCSDLCPNDGSKSDPGQCGCGNADTDGDGDGTADCIDNCPNDPYKTDPGICGCGTADTDTDADGTPDCFDVCPGHSDSADADGDGTPDGCDGCPNDPDKIDPGQCGCGIADTDADGDATADCIDGCPNDPYKINPGICGCGTADTDVDGDGTPDCFDACPNDPDKIDPGQCGCGIADTDADGDGVPDCFDVCPGYDDTADADGDGIPDGCDPDP